MRKTLALITLVGLGFGLGACGSTAQISATTQIGGGSSCTYASIQSELYKPGALTVATDSPAYPPWFENNTPSNDKGFESEVAFDVAKELGFSKSQVKWTVEPFNSSYAPGPKTFDFDINEISYSPQRAEAVTFSESYYNVQQSLVALKGSLIAAHHSPADLRNYVYGDQIGTTSLAYILNELRPMQPPSVFNNLNDVKSALQEARIQALVVDTPTAQYISSSEIPNSVMVGQFPSTGEHYGLLFAKGDPLVGCVNYAIGKLKADGTLAKLVHEYLGLYTSVPTIKP